MAAIITVPPGYDSSAEEDETGSEVSGGSNEEEEESVTQSNSGTALASELEESKTPRRFYPQDFIVQKEKLYPYEWTPNFGVLVEPTHPTLSLTEFRDKPHIDLETWNPEDGLEDALYVQWGNSPNIKHVQQSDISLVDRVIVKGFKVAKEDGTVGYVTGTEVRVAAQIMDTHHVITDIDVKKLTPVTPFVRGVEVLYDNKWVGIITHVRRSNLLRLESFTAGKKFVLETVEADGFMKQDPYSTAAINIPGQRTRLSSRQMNNVTWQGRGMNMFWNMPLKYLITTPRATYLNVRPIGITVKWLQYKPFGNSSTCLEESSKSSIDLAHKPATMYIHAADFSKIQFIGVPNYQTIQLNSVRMYQMDEKDAGKLTSFNAWMSGFRSQFMNQPDSYYGKSMYPPGSIFAALASKSTREVPVKVLLKRTYATVEWNNGVTETLPSSEIPIICVAKDSTVHRAGSVVATSFDLEGTEKYGVVQRSEEQLVAKTGTVLVKWFQVSHTDDGEEILNKLGVAEESIYDIRPHPEYTFYRLHTNVFLKKGAPGVGAKCGVVLDVDIPNGTMTLGSVSLGSETITVYPHEVVPLNQQCYWNFFTRKWHTELLLPHEHHIGVEKQVPVTSQEPISLSDLDHATPRSKSQSCLLEETQLSVEENVPTSHYFYADKPEELPQNFTGVISRDLASLHNNVPAGVWVRVYEDRVDLLSVLLLGPSHTPYEDGLFLFDLQLPINFPDVPPKIQFVSYSDPLHPFISTEGAFCVSKIEWGWSSQERPDSYIQNALLQIQSLIFSPEPFFASDLNKALKDTEVGNQFLRVYNEKVFINVLTSAINMLKYPHDPWRNVIGSHYSVALVPKLILAHKWLKKEAGGSGTEDDDPFEEEDTPPAPAYPLLPLSKGFKIALQTRLETLDKMLPVTVKEKQPQSSKKPVTLQDTGYQSVQAQESTILLSQAQVPSESTLVETIESSDEEIHDTVITASD